MTTYRDEKGFWVTTPDTLINEHDGSISCRDLHRLSVVDNRIKNMVSDDYIGGVTEGWYEDEYRIYIGDLGRKEREKVYRFLYDEYGMEDA